MSLKTADLYDRYGDKLQVAEPIFSDYGGNKTFHGDIYTLKVHEDFLLIKNTVSEKGEGRVLVIDGGGSMRCAMLGDRLAAMANANGWVGVVINGCIRDADEIGKLPIGVKALNTCPARPGKNGGGQSQIAVHFAGVKFNPGEILYADEDGIVVSPARC